MLEGNGRLERVEWSGFAGLLGCFVVWLLPGKDAKQNQSSAAFGLSQSAPTLTKFLHPLMLFRNLSSPPFCLFSVAILFLLFERSMLAAIDNCPMRVVRHIIGRAVEATGRNDAALQMQLIRRIMEDIYGGTWGVLIVSDPELISTAVHWTFPDHRHKDGSAAFCLYTENGWQYNVFKTGEKDTEDRLTVDQVAEQMNKMMNATAKSGGENMVANNKLIIERQM